MFIIKSTCLLLALAVAAIFAEVVDFKNCPNVNVDECTIHEVRVDPCPQAESHLACNIRRRHPSKMTFDYTPNFDSDTLDASVSWVKSEAQDLPLATLDRDACKYSTCPAKTGVKQTYSIDVPIESKFPLNAYTIKWVLKASSGQQCCFLTDIKLVR